MEAAARELSSADHVPSRRVPRSATQHWAPRSRDTIPVPQSHWSKGQTPCGGTGWSHSRCPRHGWETPGWKGEQRRMRGCGKQGSPAAPELPRLSAEMLQDCARLARHGSRAACESQLCTTRPRFPPLPTGLSIRCIIIIPLSFLWFVFFFLPHWLFCRSPKYLLLKGGSCRGQKPGLTGSLPAPASASPHGHSGEAPGTWTSNFHSFNQKLLVGGLLVHIKLQ